MNLADRLIAAVIAQGADSAVGRALVELIEEAVVWAYAEDETGARLTDLDVCVDRARLLA